MRFSEQYFGCYTYDTWACIYNNTFKDLGQASQEAARDKLGKQHMVDTDIPFLGWNDTFLSHNDSSLIDLTLHVCQ